MIVGVWSSAPREGASALHLARIEARFGPPRELDRRDAGVLVTFASVGAQPQWTPRRDRVSLGHRANSVSIGWNGGDGLVCERGAVGGEPLYWVRAGATWLVASRLEALIVALDGPLPLDEDQAASVVASLPPIDATRTPYRGVRRVLSGERIVLPGSSHARPGGDRDGMPREPGALVELTGSDDALGDALWRAAYESVARAAVGIRVIGVLAGGGLDSSGLLAAAVAHARDRGDLEVVPLALDFAAPGDDRPHLRALASWLGVTPVRIAPEEAAPFLRASLVVDARPSLEASLPLLAAAAAAGKRRGVEKVITGFLGDLILDSPAGATLARMRVGNLLERARAVRDAALLRDPWRTPPLQLVWHGVAAPLLRPLVPHPLLIARRRRAYGALLPWAGPRLRAFLECRAEASAALPDLTTPEQRYAALSSSPQMIAQIDTRSQVEILSGVHFSEPWMDADFCRTIARIPPWRLMAGNRERGLFRHALRGHVPDSVRLRPDKAMMEPALDRMLVAAGGEHAFGDLLRARRLVDRGLVEPAKLRKVVRAFFARRHGEDAGDTWTTLWSVAAAEAFVAASEKAPS